MNTTPVEAEIDEIDPSEMWTAEEKEGVFPRYGRMSTLNGPFYRSMLYRNGMNSRRM